MLRLWFWCAGLNSTLKTFIKPHIYFYCVATFLFSLFGIVVPNTCFEYECGTVYLVDKYIYLNVWHFISLWFSIGTALSTKVEEPDIDFLCSCFIIYLLVRNFIADQNKEIIFYCNTIQKSRASMFHVQLNVLFCLPKLLCNKVNKAGSMYLHSRIQVHNNKCMWQHMIRETINLQHPVNTRVSSFAQCTQW